MKPNPEIVSGDKPMPDVKSILTDVPYMIANLGAGLIETGLFFPYSHLQLFTILKGIVPNFAFYTLAIMNAASCPGRVIPNFFADKVGPFNASIPIGVVCAALIYSLLHINTIGGIIAFAILFGFFSGAWLSLASPCVASLSRHPGELGMRFGISFTLSGIGALIGAPIDGELLGSTFPWWKATVFSGTTIIAGSVTLVVSRHFIAKRKDTQFV